MRAFTPPSLPRARRGLTRTVALLSVVGMVGGCRFFEGDDAAASTEGAEKTDAAQSDSTETSTVEAAKEAIEEQRAGLEPFVAWQPLHAFIDAPIVAGVPVSGQEAIVLTKDDHVGVTRDGGRSWSLHRLRNGDAYAIDGYEDGPFVAVGANGYVAFSEDGESWRDLARYTGDDLVDVETTELGTIAVGKRGAFVRYDKDGSTGEVGELPDRFKARAVIEQSGAVVALAGRKAYGTVDGSNWTRFEQDLDLPSAKVALTSAGACSLGKIEGRKGVVCSVTGTAFGITDGLAAVERNGIVAVSSDAGKSWTTASLPFSKTLDIFGQSGGTMYATGRGGRIAASKNGGKSWIDLEWEDEADLNDGLVDGDTVVIVGDRSTIVYSNNGGKSWEYAQPDFGGNYDQIAKIDGKYVVTDGKVAISSKDLKGWDEEIDSLPTRPPAPEPCSELPGARASCRYASGLTTPEGIPDVTAFAFDGDIGLAWGEDGLTAFTQDGGASWSTESGLGLGDLRLIDVRDDIVVVSDGERSAVSVDAGKSFNLVQTPGKVTLYDLVIAETGNIYAVGKSGSLLRSGADPAIWLPVDTIEGDRTNFVRVFEVGTAFFAAGAKGELWRSVDGNEWLPLEVVADEPVQAMTGEKATVFAVTQSGKRQGNILLRSDDEGAHFYVVTEMSHAGPAHDFQLEGGQLRYRDRISSDMGLSWRRAVDRYWPGAEPIEDGSGKAIVAAGDRYGKDPLYVVGDEEDDWLLIEGAYSEDATVRCSKSAGCWMVAGGTLYRPE